MKKYYFEKGRKECLLLGILIITFILGVIYFGKAGINTYAESLRSEFAVESDFSNSDFENDNFIVVLDKEISGVNKIHDVSFFEGIDVASIFDLSKRNIQTENVEDFEQILQIFLNNGDREEVLEAIAIAENIDGVKSAEPNYIVGLTQASNDPEFI